MSNSNPRCIDPDGVVHYGGWRPGGYAPWCNPTLLGQGKAALPKAKGKRAMVTCLLCLRERRSRGGDGSLL